MGVSFHKPVLVGRERERQALRALLERTTEGHGALVLLSGEAGIGKTTLVDDLVQHATGEGVLVLSGGCYDLTTTPPYGPWAEILRAYQGGEHLPEIPAQFQAGGGMEGIDSQAALFDLVGRFLQGVAAAQPLLILLEDLHWADSSSLDLLRYLSRTLMDDPALLIVTYRDDEITRDHLMAPLLPALVREGRVHRLQLQRLDRESVLAMARERYRLSPEDEGRLMAYLDRLAEGNPFFTNELLYTLEEQQLLSPMAGGWQLGDLADAGVPTLVQQIIDGRLARLDVTTRDLLDLAAVIGYDAPLDLLSELHEGSSAELDAALQQLIGQRLLEVGAGLRSVRFHHALVRQAIYDGISLLQRQTLHRRVGELLDGRTRPDPAPIANHFYAAGDERALAWLERAAEQAQGLFAPASVIDHASRGIDLATRLGTDVPFGLYRLRGLAREFIGDFDGARADRETALAHARERNSQYTEWQALLDLGALWASRDYEQAGSYYQQALDLATRLDDAEMLASSHNQIGNWLANGERLTESEQHHLEALRIFQNLGDKPGMQATYDLLGVASLLAGNMVKSCRYHDQSIALLREVDNRPGLALALGSLALAAGGGQNYPLFIDPARRADVEPAGDEAREIARELGWRAIEAYTIAMTVQPHIVRGNYRQALAATLEGLKIAEDVSHAQWICYNRSNMRDIYHDLLMPEVALQYLEPALPIADSMGSIVWKSTIRSSLALGLVGQGEFGQARAMLGELPELERREISLTSLYTLLTQAHLSLAEGDLDTALALIDRVIASDPAGRGGEVPKTLIFRAEILIALGRFDDAEAALRSSVDYATDLGFRSFLWRAHALLRKVYLAQGRVEEAHEAGDTARRIISGLADQLDDERLRTTFLTNARALVSSTPPYAPDQPSADIYAGLSPRELEVLQAVADGLTDSEAGARLFIATRTVSQHLRSVYNKLGVNNRAAAVRVAVEQELV